MTVDGTLIFVVAIVLLALAFDYINGFHDAANSIATVVATRVLSPGRAVLWAAFFNFAAAFGFGLHVANTIGKGTIDPKIVDNHVILAALAGAIFWDLVTWYWGIPSSSSHALIGGLLGAGIAKAGISVVVVAGVQRTATWIVLSPLLGLALGAVAMVAVSWLTHRLDRRVAEPLFRRLQLVSAAAFSLGHGANDAQKTMGIIAVLLFSAGYLGSDFYVPLWVVLAAHAAIGLGTLAGGWRIIHTMATRITQLAPAGGYCAETAAAATLFGASHLGVPVSTTHTITGAIMGVGSVRRLSAVRWGVGARIVWAWVLTIPAAGVVAAATYWLVHAAAEGLGMLAALLPRLTA
ncbi:MAG TPA: inorganic phosphate transporter [Chloroflexota bacterium]|nr:inorganic phosphate transporter [Chloroflexota bacterium]